MAAATRKTFGLCWIASVIFLSIPALGSNVASDCSDARNYDTGGRLTEIANDNGITTTYSYRDDSGDVDNLIAEIDIEKTGPTTIDNFTYTYDANKNKVTETRTGPMSAYSSTTDPSGGGSGYDDEDRLTHWRLSSNTVTQSWSLSLIGNWNSMTENSVTETHTHNDAHELTSVDSDTLTYDAKGNMLTDATKTHTYTWDFDNKLDSLNDGSNTWEFEYDALGRRVRNDAASGDLVFVYAGQQVIATYDYGDNANAPDRNIVYGSYIDEPILIDKLTGSNQGLKYLHRNSQYSIVALTDDSGTVLERYQYTVYGETTILAPNGTTVRTDSEHGNPFAFTGRYYHSEFGLYHQRARIYDPELGKFLTRDPLGYVDGMSMYKGYFAPQGLDPSGMCDDFYREIWYAWLRTTTGQNPHVMNRNLGVGITAACGGGVVEKADAFEYIEIICAQPERMRTNTAIGLYNSGKEIGCQTIDFVGSAVEKKQQCESWAVEYVTGESLPVHRHRDWSSVGKGITSGQIDPLTHCAETGANVCTVGIYESLCASADYNSGLIDGDEYQQRMGPNSCFQLFGAGVRAQTRTPSCKNLGRNEIPLSRNAQARFRSNQMFRRCIENAERSPLGRCSESAQSLATGEQFTVHSGFRPRGLTQYPHGVNLPYNVPQTSCAMPWAASIALRRGGSPVRVTNGGITMREGAAGWRFCQSASRNNRIPVFKPACNRCLRVQRLNPFILENLPAVTPLESVPLPFLIPQSNEYSF